LSTCIESTLGDHGGEHGQESEEGKESKEDSEEEKEVTVREKHSDSISGPTRPSQHG
jgi:hypothetical protein